MSKQNSVELASRWFREVWNEHNDATLVEMLHPDAVGHIEDRVIHGLKGLRQARQEIVGAFPDFHLDIEAVIGHGEDVAARWTLSGTHTGEGFPMPPTGTRVSIRGMTWLRFVDGRMVEGWDCWNQGKLLQELLAAAQQKQGR